MPKLALAFSLLALLFSAHAALRPVEASTVPDAEAAEDEGELAYHMAYLQRYADKLHAAGAAQNWELAAFYLHEIEETAELVVDENHVEDGVEIGPLTEAMLLPAMERVEAAVRGGDEAAFVEAYGGLVTACNACHEATAHGFVRITVPERSAYPNQDFRPRSAE